MKSIAELIVRISDLAEAHGHAVRQSLRAEGESLKANIRHEGNVFRAAMARVFSAFLALVAGGFCVLIGAGFLVAASYMSLYPTIGFPAAAAIVGAVAVVVGGFAIWTFQRTMRQ